MNLALSTFYHLASIFFLLENQNVFAMSNITCRTKSAEQLPCAFPYRLKGQIENGCTTRYQNDSLEGWCPTAVDPRTLEGSNWRECCTNSSCSLLQYHTHQELMTDMERLAKKHPARAETFEIGTSTLGLPIRGIRISSNVRQGPRKSLKPMVKLLGNMHGNEPVGRELILHFADYLLGTYSYDKRTTDLVDSVDLWIVPTTNPDGFARATEAQCEGDGYTEGRYNEEKKDLNRDFPTWMDVNKTNIEEGRQKETVMIMRFAHRHPFVLSANFHDGAVVASYPWDDYHSKDEQTWKGISRTPDHDVFKHLALTYSRNHKTMRNSDICPKWERMDNGITNGAEWYPVIGGMQDFNYIFTNALEVTVEVSCCKFPDRKRLLLEWENNRDSIMSYVEQVHLGIKGIVMDSAGKTADNAEVRFIHPKTGKIAGASVNASVRGEYWKLLMPGKSYRVSARATARNGNVISSDPIDIPVKEDSTTVVHLRLNGNL